MIISRPTRKIIGQEIEISSQIQFQTHQKGFPKELWFRFPQTVDPCIEIDPFVVSLLLLAMQLKEPIQVEGSISKKLFSGLNEYQKVFNEWFPNRFHMVPIQANELIVRENQTNTMSDACAFSGGVDSFFTFYSPEIRPAETLFMAGFDMPRNLTHSIAELTHSYQDLMSARCIGFVAGSTNIRNFVNTVEWTNSHGQALVASALFFQHRWKRFYIPSSYTGKTYPKWGTHPRLDHLLSTEGLSFIHHGEKYNRLNKLKVIAQHPECFNRLRVCWIQDIGLKNCGECEKCIRTMIALEILGVLKNYSTFKKPLNRKAIRSLSQRTHQARLFAQELMREALARGRLSIFIDLAYSLLRRNIFRKIKLHRQ